MSRGDSSAVLVGSTEQSTVSSGPVLRWRRTVPSEYFLSTVSDWKLYSSIKILNSTDPGSRNLCTSASQVLVVITECSSVSTGQVLFNSI